LLSPASFTRYSIGSLCSLLSQWENDGLTVFHLNHFDDLDSAFPPMPILSAFPFVKQEKPKHLPFGSSFSAIFSLLSLTMVTAIQFP
jgi:hypothetical protein